MADAENKATDIATTQTDVIVAKQWTDEEVQKIISERDKSKNKLRSFEDDKKKQEDAKLIEEGKLKELLVDRDRQLIDLQGKATKYDEEMKKLKDNVLSRITDEGARQIIAKLDSIDDISKLAESFQSTKIKVDSSKASNKLPEAKFKSYSEFENYLKSQNLAI